MERRFPLPSPCGFCFVIQLTTCATEVLLSRPHPKYIVFDFNAALLDLPRMACGGSSLTRASCFSLALRKTINTIQLDKVNRGGCNVFLGW